MYFYKKVLISSFLILNSFNLAQSQNINFKTKTLPFKYLKNINLKLDNINIDINKNSQNIPKKFDINIEKIYLTNNKKDYLSISKLLKSYKIPEKGVFYYLFGNFLKTYLNSNIKVNAKYNNQTQRLETKIIFLDKNNNKFGNLDIVFNNFIMQKPFDNDLNNFLETLKDSNIRDINFNMNLEKIIDYKIIYTVVPFFKEMLNYNNKINLAFDYSKKNDYANILINIDFFKDTFFKTSYKVEKFFLNNYKVEDLNFNLFDSILKFSKVNYFSGETKLFIPINTKKLLEFYPKIENLTKIFNEKVFNISFNHKEIFKGENVISKGSLNIENLFTIKTSSNNILAINNLEIMIAFLNNFKQIISYFNSKVFFINTDRFPKLESSLNIDDFVKANEAKISFENNGFVESLLKYYKNTKKVKNPKNAFLKYMKDFIHNKKLSKDGQKYFKEFINNPKNISLEAKSKTPINYNDIFSILLGNEKYLQIMSNNEKIDFMNKYYKRLLYIYSIYMESYENKLKNYEEEIKNKQIILEKTKNKDEKNTLKNEINKIKNIMKKSSYNRELYKNLVNAIEQSMNDPSYLNLLKYYNNLMEYDKNFLNKHIKEQLELRIKLKNAINDNNEKEINILENKLKELEEIIIRLKKYVLDDINNITTITEKQKRDLSRFNKKSVSIDNIKFNYTVNIK